MSVLPLHQASSSRIFTKFYYGEKGLCFDLILENKHGSSKEIGTYTDYNEYKIAFEDLKNLVERDAPQLTTRQIKKSA